MSQPFTAAMCARGRRIADPRLDPAGERVAFVSSSGGHSAVLVCAAGGGEESTLTAEAVAGAHPKGGGVFAWTPDGAGVVFVDNAGALWRVPAAGGTPDLLVRGAEAASPAVSPDGLWVAYVTDGRHVAVAANDAAASAPWPMRLSSGSNDFAVDPAWSTDGRSIAWTEWDVPDMAWDGSRIVVAPLDGRDEPRVVAGGSGVAAQQARFSPDGARLGYLSDANGFTNLWVADADGKNARPLIEEPFEHAGPTWGPGQRTWAWSPDGGRVAFCRNEGGFGRLCIADAKTGEVREVARGWHFGLSWSADRLVAVRTGARTPPALVVYSPVDQDFPSRRVLLTGGVAFPRDRLVEPEVVHWAAEDGAEIHGRLYRPLGASGPTPMLVWIHGGPTDQQTVTFDPRVAFFVDRDWSVLVPDHRGSTGWGRAYTQAMAGRWGDLDSSDTAAGIRAAIDRGWADPARVVPIGASAGGFTVLCLLAWHGTLCAAGVDLYGVADLLELDEKTHRFEKHYLQSIVGPLPEAVERYRARSPLNLAGDIKSPLLILHGDEDKVVPVEQSLSLADRVRRAGGTVEMHVYEGEGHGWSRPETTEDELERIDDFLRRHVLRWRSEGPG